MVFARASRIGVVAECSVGRAFGSMGRVYLGGEERDIDVGWQAAVAAIEGIEGRDAKG